MKKVVPIVEQRTTARRKRSDRREMIRWEKEKADRRSAVGQRKEDKALESVRSVYQSSAPTRRVPLARGGNSPGKPLRVERRAGVRRETDVRVGVYRGADIKTCKLLDIGLDGAFIETGTFALPKGAHIELVLKIRPRGKVAHCRLPAKIIRAEMGGAALKFDDLDTKLYSILLGIVKPFKRKPHLRVISSS